MKASVAWFRSVALGTLAAFAASGAFSSRAALAEDGTVPSVEPRAEPAADVLEWNVPWPELPGAAARKPRGTSRYRPLVELVRPAEGDTVVLERAGRILAELGAQGLEVLVRTCPADEPTCAVGLPPLAPANVGAWAVVARVVVEAAPGNGVRVEPGGGQAARSFGRAQASSDDPAAIAIQVGEVVHGLSLAAEERWRGRASRNGDVSQVPDDELPFEPPLPVAAPRPRVTGTVAWATIGHAGSLGNVAGPLFALRWRTSRGWGARAAGVWMLQPRSLTPTVQLSSHVHVALEVERWFGHVATGLGAGFSYLAAGTQPIASSSGWVWSGLLSGRVAVQFPALSRLRGEVGLSAFLLALPVVFHQGDTVVASTGRWGSLLWLGWDLG